MNESACSALFVLEQSPGAEAVKVIDFPNTGLGMTR
jgi:hypothetical protein